MIRLKNILTEVDDEQIIKYKDKDGNPAEMKAGSAKTMEKGHPAKVAWDKMAEKEAGDDTDTKGAQVSFDRTADSDDGEDTTDDMAYDLNNNEEAAENAEEKIEGAMYKYMAEEDEYGLKEEGEIEVSFEKFDEKGNPVYTVSFYDHKRYGDFDKKVTINQKTGEVAKYNPATKAASYTHPDTGEWRDRFTYGSVLESKNSGGMIRLKSLFTEADTFKAKSKKTGRTVVYKSKDALKNAIKSGAAEPIGKEPYSGKSDDDFRADIEKQHKSKKGVSFDRKPDMDKVFNKGAVDKQQTTDEPFKPAPKSIPLKKGGLPQDLKQSMANVSSEEDLKKIFPDLENIQDTKETHQFFKLGMESEGRGGKKYPIYAKAYINRKTGKIKMSHVYSGKPRPFGAPGFTQGSDTIHKDADSVLGENRMVKLKDILKESEFYSNIHLHDDSGIVFSEKGIKRAARPELYFHLFSNINAAKNYSKVLGNMLRTIKGIKRFSDVPTDFKVMKGKDFIKKYPKVVEKLNNSRAVRYKDKPWNDLYDKFDRTGTKLKFL